MPAETTLHLTKAGRRLHTVHTMKKRVTIELNGRSLPEAVASSNRALTLAELSRLMNCSKGKLYDLVKRNRVPHSRIAGSMIRFDPKPTAEWLRSQAIEI